MKIFLAALALPFVLASTAHSQTLQARTWAPVSSLNNFKVEVHQGLTVIRSATDFSTVLRLRSLTPVRLGTFMATSEQAHVSASCNRRIYTVEERVTMSTEGEIRILRSRLIPTPLSATSTDWIERALLTLCTRPR